MQDARRRHARRRGLRPLRDFGVRAAAACARGTISITGRSATISASARARTASSRSRTASCGRRATASRASTWSARARATPSRPTHDVAARDVPFEFMMNALRLTDGFPLSLFEERAGTAARRGAERARRGRAPRAHRARPRARRADRARAAIPERSARDFPARAARPHAARVQSDGIRVIRRRRCPTRHGRASGRALRTW